LDFIHKSHRQGYEIIQSVPELKELWDEIELSLHLITDEDVKRRFGEIERDATSFSQAINELIDESLRRKGWKPQSRIFKDLQYDKKTWTLDFSKQVLKNDGSKSGMAVEVAFNHRQVIAWNLLKPVLAAEMNHLPKETDIGEGVGVIICATEDLRESGGFDSAVGTYENFLANLKPLSQVITTPMVILGLEPLRKFKIEVKKTGGKKLGEVIDLDY
jgi:hypothetical protein